MNLKPQPNIFKLGCHLSSSKGFLHMGREALTINANTFQFFTRNPRGSRAKPIDPKDAEALCNLMVSNNFAPIMAHAPYTLNPASGKDKIWEFAHEVMADDLARMEYIPGNFYNLHPGSHTGLGVLGGIKQICNLLNDIMTKEQKTTVLLETMAGKGTEIGGSFEELQAILDSTVHNDKIGVCLDTCHIFDGGYNVLDDLEGVLEKFDKSVGLDKLKAVHLNDSLNSLGARKDRHAKIGEGQIGWAALVKIINHPVLYQLPFYLETPNDVAGYAVEIKKLRAAYHPEF